MKDKNTINIINRLGGVTKIASILGISKAAVSRWSKIPVERCVQLEKLTDKSVTRMQMRPDIFSQ